MRKQISITLDVELIEQIDAIAKNLGMSRASVINMLLNAGFNGDYGSIFKALKDARNNSAENQSEENLAFA